MWFCLVQRALKEDHGFDVLTGPPDHLHSAAKEYRTQYGVWPNLRVLVRSVRASLNKPAVHAPVVRSTSESESDPEDQGRTQAC